MDCSVSLSVSRARGDGSAIVTEMQSNDDPPVVGQSTYRLSADGRELSLGGWRKAPGFNLTITQVYTKAAP